MSTFTCRVAATPDVELIVGQLDAAGRIAADHMMVVGGEIHLTLSDAEIGELAAAGVPVTRLSALQVLADRTDGAGTPPAVDLVSGFVTGYLDAEQVAAQALSLAATFPTWCTVTTLPFPTSGYDGSFAPAAGPGSVQLLRITTNPTVRSKPGFLLIGGTHAREWMNPLIALEFAEQLLRNVDPASADPVVMAITHIVTTGDVLVIPALNPDGLTYSVHDAAGWRKNRRPGGACSGVDNNRNYEVYFGGAGSSPMPCLETYQGPSAMSEPENCNVAYVLEQFPNVLVGVDAHSFGEQILRPNPAGGSFIATEPVSAADNAVYTALETTLRTAIGSVNGAVYSTGSTSNHAGTSDEYMFFAHRVFGFNTECGDDFQPPWATAAPVISELVTGLRALAAATVDLVATTPTPLSVVQCIDRTGSMIAFGYDGTARANAKRFTDLLSLGDSTAVVSFADPDPDPTATPPSARAQVEIPLTPLNDPGDAATVRAAIDGISFGGWTPIGAGLQRSASVLTGAAAPTAVLLLSDGFENRDPTVASTLPMLPAGLRVFTVALGPAADATLLQQIATDTGGLFQLSPTALDLHQVYNEMRAGITDDGLLVNDLISPTDDTDHIVDVEPGADRLTVSVSGSGFAPESALVAPSGRPVRTTDHGVRATSGDGYRLLTIDRPVPGRWRIRIGKARGPVVVGAFLGSPLRVHIELPASLKAGGSAELTVRASFDGKDLGPVRVLARSQALRPVDLRRAGGLARLGGAPDPDGSKPGSLGGLEKRVGWQKPVRWPEGRIESVPAGMSRVLLQCEGTLPGGKGFRRVARRTIHGRI